ncbi:hypothetical protein Tco_0749792, partial [Tanacetum coccineum]
ESTDATSSSDPAPPTSKWLKIDSIEAWDILAEIFSDNKSSWSIALKEELHSLKLVDLSIDAYFRKIESITTILASLGSSISKDDIVTIALDGLSDKYEHVSDIIIHREPFPDLNMVHSMLTIAEMQLKSRAQAPSIDSSSSSPMVLLANSSTNSARRSTGNSGLCFWKSISPTLCLAIQLFCITQSTGSGGPVGSSGSVGSSVWSTFGTDTSSPNVFNVMTLQDPATANRNICTSASSHLNISIFNLSNVFNLCIYLLVSVGDGYSIPITNSGHSILPTPHRPLHLNSVLSTPNIVKNLIYVCQFVCDNHSTVEYDAFGFSVKDFLTIPYAFVTSQYTSHQCLGHLRSKVCVMFFLVIQFRVIKRNNPFFVMLLSLENM